jgi:hypothetical protein
VERIGEIIEGIGIAGIKVDGFPELPQGTRLIAGTPPSDAGIVEETGMAWMRLSQRFVDEGGLPRPTGAHQLRGPGELGRKRHHPLLSRSCSLGARL